MDDFTELQRPLSGRRAPASRCSFVAALAVVGIVAFAAGALFTSAGSSAHLAKLAESPIPSPVAKGERFRKKLIFSDEFDFLDFTKWRHEISMSGGGNWGFELYSNNRSNSFVRNGSLHLHPTLTADSVGDELVEEGGELDMWGATPASQCTSNAFWGCYRTSGLGGNMINPIQSAKLFSHDAFSFTYGRVEVRAKLPRGDWLWPAIWLLPKREEYGKWPASGEIDLVEGRGNQDITGGSDTVASTLHWGPSWQDNHWAETHSEHTLAPGSGDFSDEWHTFGLYWDENELYTYVDDDSNVIMREVFNESFWDKANRVHGDAENSRMTDNPWQDAKSASAPFDKEFYLIFNLAVGGTNAYFGDTIPGKPWTSKTKHAVDLFWKARDKWLPTWQGEHADLRIDWVRVWQD